MQSVVADVQIDSEGAAYKALADFKPLPTTPRPPARLPRRLIAQTAFSDRKGKSQVVFSNALLERL